MSPLARPATIRSALLRPALAENVAYVPGESFFARGGGKNTLRMNFSNANPEKIRLGVSRLGRVFTENLKELERSNGKALA